MFRFVIILITIFNALFPDLAFAQLERIDATHDNINQNTGTMIVRAITKEKSINKDSVVITGKVFSVSCRQFKWSKGSVDFIYADSISGNGKLREDNTYYLKLPKGKHKIITHRPENLTQWPYKSKELSFKGGRRYEIDIFIAGKNLNL